MIGPDLFNPLSLPAKHVAKYFILYPYTRLCIRNGSPPKPSTIINAQPTFIQWTLLLPLSTIVVLALYRTTLTLLQTSSYGIRLHVTALCTTIPDHPPPPPLGQGQRNIIFKNHNDDGDVKSKMNRKLETIQQNAVQQYGQDLPEFVVRLAKKSESIPTILDYETQVSAARVRKMMISQQLSCGQHRFFLLLFSAGT